MSRCRRHHHTPCTRPSRASSFLPTTATDDDESEKRGTNGRATRIVVLVLLMVLPFALATHGEACSEHPSCSGPILTLADLRDVWWAPLLGLSAILPASGLPVCGGIIFFPVLSALGYPSEEIRGFISATVAFEAGCFAPAAWAAIDTSVFLWRPIFVAMASGSVTLTIGLIYWDLDLFHTELVFLVFIVGLIIYTVRGLFKELAVQDGQWKASSPRMVATLVLSGLVGGLFTKVIGFGIEKFVFVALTMRPASVDSVKAGVSCIVVVGWLSIISAGVHFSRGTVPIAPWVCVLPGIVFGSLVGPSMSRLFGRRCVLWLFVAFIFADAVKTSNDLLTWDHESH